MMLLYRLCLWKSGKMLLALILLDWLFAASTDATTRKYDLVLIILEYTRRYRYISYL